MVVVKGRGREERQRGEGKEGRIGGKEERKGEREGERRGHHSQTITITAIGSICEWFK